MWNGNFAYYLSKREILLLFAPTTEMNSGLGGDRAKRANIQCPTASRSQQEESDKTYVAGNLQQV